MAYEYSLDVLVSTHQSFVDVVDGAVGQVTVDIVDASEIVLATILMSDPSGLVDSGDGSLSFYSDGTGPYDVTTSGTASKAILRAGDGAWKLTMPCTEGPSAVSGECVIDSVTLTAGQTVTFVALTIG